ncbi:hypothetical protein N9W89_00440 [Hellea sp.]|nr:hypothetical protein [Hellea sp.]
MLRTIQTKSLSQRLAKQMSALLSQSNTGALVPVEQNMTRCDARLEFARFNRETPRRRRYRRAGVAAGPAALRTSWY